MKYFTLIAIIIIKIFSMNQVNAQTSSETEKGVEIAGLILDSETLKPVEGAIITDENGIEIGNTNSSGYFRVKIGHQEDEEKEIWFSFDINKKGYEHFTQSEHWGSLTSSLHAAYFIGLKNQKSINDSFSEMEWDISDLTFESIMEAYKDIREDIDFEMEIESIKKKNDKIFFKIGANFYVVSDSGWLKLNSKSDRILIDKGRVIIASNINSIMKRKDIVDMTPIVSDTASFEINTIK